MSYPPPVQGSYPYPDQFGGPPQQPGHPPQPPPGPGWQQYPPQPPGYAPTPPPPQPRPLSWVGTLSYLQFVAGIVGSIIAFTMVSGDKSTWQDDDTAPRIGSVGLAVSFLGMMVLLTIASLLMAVFLSRRESWVRTMAVTVQSGFVGALAVGLAMMLNANLTAVLLVLGACAGVAALAAVNLILLSRPATRDWYAWEG